MSEYGMRDITSSLLPKETNPNVVWKVTTEPTVEPITITQLKDYARIDGDLEDSKLSTIIIATRSLIEDYINRALIEQSITLQMDYWPENPIELPKPPLIAITSITTLDESGTATTYSSSNYFTITNATPGKLLIKNSVTPPENSNRYYGGFRIIYTAGYGSTATYVPQQIKEAMKSWATMIYEGAVSSNEPPPIAAKLLNAYRVYHL